MRSESANDSDFKRTLSRACPLRSTFCHIQGQPKTLVLYKIKASRHWQCRFAYAGKMIVKSTRTFILDDAKRFAIALYHRHFDANDPGVKHDDVIETTTTLFSDLAIKLMGREASRCARGDLAHLSYKADQIRLATEIVPYFGALPVHAIDARLIESFCTKLESRSLSSTTLSLYLMTLRKVLKYAHSLNHIETIPSMPSVKIKKRSRGSFTPTEYVRLIRSARRLVGSQVLSSTETIPKRFWIIPRYRTYPSDLAHAIAFMVNSFIRPSDIKTLRHRHVETIKGQHNYLRLTLPETKAHDAPIVTLRPAVRLYEHMFKRQVALGFGKPNDYLFLPGERNRDYALAVLGWMFRHLLETLGLREGPHGHPRTLYSLRHTAITLRLLYGTGIDMLTLARNARTSIEMIERHYASALTAERNIGMLQSKRSPRERN